MRTMKINETHVKIGFFGMLLVVLAGIHLAIPDFYRTVWALSTSGNMQEVKELWADCDRDTLLVKVDSPGPACHTGNRTCFFKRVEGGTR